MAELLPGEEIVESQDINEVDQVRQVIADVYTFIRSQEINRTIGGFTFDHYIDEAKRQIIGEGRAIRSASGEAIDVRPTKMEMLTRLETLFNETYEKAGELAKKADKDTEEESEEEEIE